MEQVRNTGRMMCEEVIGTLVHDALEIFFEKDAYLVSSAGGERCIAHRLAVYIEQLLGLRGEGWCVDCEYNRYGNQPKFLDQLKDTLTRKGSRRRGDVAPDIVVHRRGTTGPNLLAIEVKRARREFTEDLALDLFKLEQYRDQLGYEHALMLQVGSLYERCRVDFLRRDTAEVAGARIRSEMAARAAASRASTADR